MSNERTYVDCVLACLLAQMHAVLERFAEVVGVRKTLVGHRLFIQQQQQQQQQNALFVRLS